MKFSKSWCFETISKTDQYLTSLTKRWEKTYINKIINEKGDITAHTNGINKSQDIL